MFQYARSLLPTLMFVFFGVYYMLCCYGELLCDLPLTSASK